MDKLVIVTGLTALKNGAVRCGVARLVNNSSVIETVLFKTRNHSNYFCALTSILEIIKKHPEIVDSLEIYQQSALGFTHPEKSPNSNLLIEINRLVPNLKATVVTGVCQSLVQEVKAYFENIPFDRTYILKDEAQSSSKVTGKEKTFTRHSAPIVEECNSISIKENNHRMTADGWASRKMWINDHRLQIIIATFEKLDDERKEMVLDYVRSIRRPEDGNINKL